MDFVTDQEPTQPNDADAAGIYQSKITPSIGKTIGSMMGDNPTEMLGRAAERGEQQGSSWFDHALNSIGSIGFGEYGTAGMASQTEKQLPSAQLNPKEAKEQYGLDTTQPISEGLAKVVSKQQSDHEERDGVISRFQDAHSLGTNFAVGTVAFMMDPLNVATMFVPGLGEEAVLGRLGTGLAARTAARAVGGATAGALGQIPLAGLRASLSPEEGVDYGIRDAFKDLAFGAVGGAAFGAVLGGALHETGFLGNDRVGEAAERLRNGPGTSVDGLGAGEPTGDTGGAPNSRELNGITSEAAQTLKTASADQIHAGMSTAVSQILDGRPVDVTPVFNPNDHLEDAARLNHPDLFNQKDELQTQLSTLKDALRLSTEKLADNPRVEEINSQVDTILGKVKGVEDRLTSTAKSRLDALRTELEATPTKLDTGESAAIRAQIQDRNEKLWDLLPQIGEAKARTRELLTSDSEYGQQYRDYLQQTTPDKVEDTANAQASLYKDGFAQGLTDDEFKSAKEDVENAPTEKPASTEPGAPAAKDDLTPEVAHLESMVKEFEEEGSLTQEDKDELQGSQDLIDQAAKRGKGFDLASGCAKEAGI